MRSQVVLSSRRRSHVKAAKSQGTAVWTLVRGLNDTALPQWHPTIFPINQHTWTGKYALPADGPRGIAVEIPGNPGGVLGSTSRGRSSKAPVSLSGAFSHWNSPALPGDQARGDRQIVVLKRANPQTSPGSVLCAFLRFLRLRFDQSARLWVTINGRIAGQGRS